MHGLAETSALLQRIGQGQNKGQDGEESIHHQSGYGSHPHPHAHQNRDTYEELRQGQYHSERDCTLAQKTDSEGIQICFNYQPCADRIGQLEKPDRI